MSRLPHDMEIEEEAAVRKVHPVHPTRAWLVRAEEVRHNHRRRREWQEDAEQCLEEGTRHGKRPAPPGGTSPRDDPMGHAAAFGHDRHWLDLARGARFQRPPRVWTGQGLWLASPPVGAKYPLRGSDGLELRPMD